MGKAAPGTTTIAFNAPAEEKTLLRELAKAMGVNGHSEAVRVLYIEAAALRHPTFAEKIKAVRRKHDSAVAERLAMGAAKRANNIKAAHEANKAKVKSGADVAGDAVKVLSNALKPEPQATPEAPPQSFRGTESQHGAGARKASARRAKPKKN